MKQAGILYVVATPIGNLGDITMRAIETLKLVDAIAAEDTRHSTGLLSHLGISKKLIAVHEHNEQQSAQQLLQRIQQGEHIALITDAGTPGISDPGAVVVDVLRAHGVKVVPIPGPSAVVTALSVAGIVENGFMFVGFLPASAAQRRKKLESLQALTTTLVFYEAPHRIMECMESLVEVLGGERRITIARELTKTFETIHRCYLHEASAWLAADSNQQRGEFVLVVEAPLPQPAVEVNQAAERVLRLLLDALPLKQAAKLAADITGAKKNALYEMALKIKNS